MNSHTFAAFVESDAHGAAASLATHETIALAERSTGQVDSNLYDLLVYETIDRLIESTALAQKRERDLENLALSHLGGQPKDTPSTTHEQAMVTQKLERIGNRIGHVTSERLAKDRQRFTIVPLSKTGVGAIEYDNLEIVKFICKEIWIALYDKQIDNLRTNHRGVYVLHDNSFKSLYPLIGASQSSEVAQKIGHILNIPCGIIQGVLAHFGITSTVIAEWTNAPSCTFQIRVTKP